MASAHAGNFPLSVAHSIRFPQSLSVGARQKFGLGYCLLVSLFRHIYKIPDHRLILRKHFKMCASDTNIVCVLRITSLLSGQTIFRLFNLVYILSKSNPMSCFCPYCIFFQVEGNCHRIFTRVSLLLQTEVHKLFRLMEQRMLQEKP